jgi:hypothetical protein
MIDYLLISFVTIPALVLLLLFGLGKAAAWLTHAVDRSGTE